MLFVAAASAASSPCAGSSLFFCEDFGAGRDGWVEGRGDAKQFASHKHPWPASVAKADDAGVLLDRRLGAGVLGKALPKAVRMSEVPLSLSFELTGVNAFDEEEREVGMLLHPMTCYGADVKLLGWFGPQTPPLEDSSENSPFVLQFGPEKECRPGRPDASTRKKGRLSLHILSIPEGDDAQPYLHELREVSEDELEVPRREKGLPSLLEMKRNITHRFSLNTQPDGAFTIYKDDALVLRGRMDEDFLPPLFPKDVPPISAVSLQMQPAGTTSMLFDNVVLDTAADRAAVDAFAAATFDATLAEQRKAVDAWKQKQRRAKVERSKHVFDDRDAPFWEKEDQTIAYWIYASAGVVLLAILLLLCAPAKPEDDDEKRD